jgi:hypothetical protein
MKKLISLVTLIVSILSGNAYAQKAKVGITAGATIGSYKLKAQGVSVTSKGKAGLTVGVFTDIPVGSSMSFMPALNFVQKGGKLNVDGMNDKLTTNYLEVPLNFAYNVKLTNGKFFIGAGPALNMGISGKDKWETEGYSGSDKVKFGKDEDFKRFDAGLNFVTGLVGKAGWLVSFNYNTGLSSSSDVDGVDGKFYKRYFGLRVGYML